MNILVVKLSAFGDIIHSLPALDDLLARPEVNEVHWLVDSRYRFVTEIFPTRVIVHDVAMKGAHPVRSAWQAIRTLRRIGLDAVLDLQGLIKSAVLARACGSPVYGIDTEQLREKQAGWLQRPTRFHAEDKHVVQQYRRVATAPFVSDPRRMPEAPLPYVTPSIHADTLAKLLDESVVAALGLASRRYIVLHSASAWPTKRLPAETWIAIARGAIARGLVPVFPWGNDAERQAAHKLCSDAGGMLLPERLNMSALTALLSKAEAVLGADTGLLHLAAALGTPTITFWGPTPSWRNSPMGDKNWHIESNPPCGPCIKRSCDQFICMPSIRSEDVLEVIDELVAH
jgi:lipopolysaccharide heptosyltransferase I